VDIIIIITLNATCSRHDIAKNANFALNNNKCRSTRTYYPDFEPILHLLVKAVCLARRHEIPYYGVWFNSAGARTHDDKANNLSYKNSLSTS
jgi:hypothetical protein